MSDDVVAELDAELALIEELPYRVPIHLLAKRARDEILALRKLTDGDWVWQQITNTRGEALEEAAQICELSAEIMQPDADEGRLSDAIAAVRSCAAAIRALKGKR